MDSLNISTIDTATPSITTTSTTIEESTTLKEKPGTSTKPIENNQSNYSIWEDQVDLATLTETINIMTYSQGKKEM